MVEANVKSQLYSQSPVQELIASREYCGAETTHLSKSSVSTYLLTIPLYTFISIGCHHMSLKGEYGEHETTQKMYPTHAM